MPQKIIQYGLHQLDDDDIEAVVNVLRSGAITQGGKSEEFGERLAATAGAKYGLAVSSGTAALHLSVSSLGLQNGDEVITTPMTFCATANAVLYEGGEVRFADIDSTTLNIDPSLIEKQITARTKAIIPVDFRGHPANLPVIKEIADQFGLKVVEDGAHSFGSKYTYNDYEHTCGDCAHADLCTFSFHPVKHLTTGEGGAVLTNDADLFNRLRLLTKHGIERRENMFNAEKEIGSWFYDMECLGYNYRLTDFQAALGLSQLKKLDAFRKRRREIVEFYNLHLKEIEELTLPEECDNVESNFHLYVLQVKSNLRFTRYDLYNHLYDKGYRTMVHYIPVHLLSFYQERYGHKRGDYPNSEKFYDGALSIPLYPSLTDNEVEQVVIDIKQFVDMSGNG